MEISQKQILGQIDHLLDGIESEDPEITRKIDGLKNEVRGLLHLCMVGGYEIAIKLGIDKIGSQLDEIIQDVRVK